jgi:hypothetical protein
LGSEPNAWQKLSHKQAIALRCLGDRRRAMLTHSKGDRILSMAAGVGAIAERACLLNQRAIAFLHQIETEAIILL